MNYLSELLPNQALDYIEIAVRNFHKKLCKMQEEGDPAFPKGLADMFCAIGHYSLMANLQTERMENSILQRHQLREAATEEEK